MSYTIYNKKTGEIRVSSTGTFSENLVGTGEDVVYEWANPATHKISSGKAVPKEPDLSQKEQERAEHISFHSALSMKSPFTSDALGSVHTYGNSETDQLNRLIASQSGIGCEITCADISGKWTPKQHNQGQLLKVISDGAAWVDACRTQRKSLEEKLNSAKTQEDDDVVVWTKPQQGNNK